MSWVIVAAAGAGRRMAAAVPKQYLPLAGACVLDVTLDCLAAVPQISGIMLVLAADDRHWRERDSLAGKPLLRCSGGAQRADSVLAGLRALPDSVAADDWVLVHDAARPLLAAADVARLFAALEGSDGALLGAPLRDTVKQLDGGQAVLATVPREQLWRAFTPQAFRRGQLTAALDSALAEGVTITDEAMAMERTGLRPRLVEGSDDNLKITTPADLRLAEFLLQQRGMPGHT